MNDLVERAKALAYRAHAGQVDKAGRPYIEHVARVAAAVRDPGCMNCPGCDLAEAVAWLHDCFEDGRVDPRVLDALFSHKVAESVEALNQTLFSNRVYYYNAIRANPIALRVKLADIADNADENRLALLDEKTADRLRRKYTKALDALT